MDLRVPFDKDGIKFAIPVAFFAICIGMISTNMGWLGFLMTIGCLLFFRDPERVSPTKPNIVVSPADGIVLKITECSPPDELKLTGIWKRISIFMSIINVHVNRAPVAGTVEKLFYVPGRFFNVTLDKASEFNERLATYMYTKEGVQIVFVQIAGLIARRIRSDIKDGDTLELGQRVGMIRFGSRVDVYVPESADVIVEEGQVTVAGETILAQLHVTHEGRKKLEHGEKKHG